jgi:hypothetical protein
MSKTKLCCLTIALTAFLTTIYVISYWQKQILHKQSRNAHSSNHHFRATVDEHEIVSLWKQGEEQPFKCWQPFPDGIRRIQFRPATLNGSALDLEILPINPNLPTLRVRVFPEGS